MNKREMADHLAVGTDLDKAAARDALDGVFEAIGEALAMATTCGSRVLGHSASRAGRPGPGATPRTGEAVSISASTSPTFKAGKTLKDTVNAGPGS